MKNQLTILLTALLALVFINQTTASDAKKNYREGRKMAEVGDYEKAIEHFTKAIEYKPDYVDAYINRGYLRQQLEDYKLAVKDFDRVIEMDPDNVDAWINRGNAKDYMGDYEGAIQDYNQALKLAPEDEFIYYNRGVAKINHGDYMGGIRDLNIATKINPLEVDAFFDKGVAFFYLERYDAAQAEFDSTLKVNDEDYEALHYRGISKIMQDLDDGCVDLKMAMEEGYEESAAALQKYCDDSLHVIPRVDSSAMAKNTEKKEKTKHKDVKPHYQPNQLEMVYFNFDSYDVNKDYMANMDKVLDLLSKYPDTELYIRGHTDSIGNKTYNVKLSEKRANEVKEYFVKKGLEEDRINILPMAFQVPIASNDTREGRMKNRRVDFEIK